MIQGQGKILIVDDEPPLLKMLGVYLGRIGYSVNTVNTTEKAWIEFSAAPIDYSVAVLDASMTGISMQDLASRMLTTNPEMRVLAASGYPVDITSLEAAAPGRVAFLHKPFTPQMLAEAVRRMLGSQEEKL